MSSAECLSFSHLMACRSLVYSSYNFVLGLPIILLGVLDRDVSAQAVIEHPASEIWSKALPAFFFLQPTPPPPPVSPRPLSVCCRTKQHGLEHAENVAVDPDCGRSFGGRLLDSVWLVRAC
jgi:hypothetical protein